MDTVSQIEKYDTRITTPPEIIPWNVICLSELVAFNERRIRNSTPVDKPEDDVVE